MGLEGGPNLYAYVMNAPLNAIDRYGLFSIDLSWLSQFAYTLMSTFCPSYFPPSITFDDSFEERCRPNRRSRVCSDLQNSDSHCSRTLHVNCQLPEPPNGLALFVNGMYNTLEEGILYAQHLSSLSGG